MPTSLPPEPLAVPPKSNSGAPAEENAPPSAPWPEPPPGVAFAEPPGLPEPPGSPPDEEQAISKQILDSQTGDFRMIAPSNVSRGYFDHSPQRGPEHGAALAIGERPPARQALLRTAGDALHDIDVRAIRVAGKEAASERRGLRVVALQIHGLDAQDRGFLPENATREAARVAGDGG